MAERLITPENIRMTAQANKEINAFVDMLKSDGTTFGHICKQYMEILKKYYPEVVNTIIDIRLIDEGLIDVELNSGIITFTKHYEHESVGLSSYHIVNDICLADSAEIETESGYMEPMTVKPLMHGGYHVIFGIE